MTKITLQDNELTISFELHQGEPSQKEIVEAMRPYIASTRKGKQKVVDALDNATEV
jgi:hypothetical protein